MIMLSKRPVAMRIALRPLALAASLILSTPFALNATTFGTDLLEGQVLDGIGTGAGNLGTVADIQNTLSNMLRDEAAIGTLASVLPQALQRLPDDRQLRLLQAVVWAATRRDDDARAQMAQIGQEPPNVWRHVAEGLIARNAGDLARAAASLDEARALDPDNAYVHNTAGSIAFAAGDLEAAQEHFAQAVKSAPGWPRLLRQPCRHDDRTRQSARGPDHSGRKPPSPSRLLRHPPDGGRGASVARAVGCCRSRAAHLP
ncbi:tetratricopeptide repeat protein [Roseobacter denitrificans]|nr:tetratricopeptide repeat protein [Roseobacter denitrificans]